MVLIFSGMEHIEIKLWKMRELPFTYTVCQLIMSENICCNTAERIQIMTMNKCKRDLNKNKIM